MKKFNDYLEEAVEDQEKSFKITVKDLISYLEKFNPETEVTLEKDGWAYYADLFDAVTKDEVLEAIFQPYKDTISIQN